MQRRDTEVLDRMTDAFFAVDEEWQFTYLNERGREVICRAIGREATVEELEGENIWAEIPEAVDTPFYEHYHEAMEHQRTVEFEAHYEPLDTWFEVSAYPSETGLSVYFRDVTERRERERTLRERERVLTEMYGVISEKDVPFEEKVDTLLSLGRDVLGTEYGALSRVQGDDYVFEVVHDPDGETEPGDVVPLQATNCERAIDTEETLVLSNVAREAPDLADRAGYTDWGIECYLGTPVVVDGDVYGTFCFYDRRPRDEQFTDWEVALVDLMGNWVSYEQERVHHQRELTRERNRLESFAGIVSHDLRNPLGVAAGRVEMAREERDDEHLAAAGDALDRMQQIVEDVLTLARVGGDDLEERPVDVDDLAEDAWATAGDGGGDLVLEDPPTVTGDRSRLRQLLENLFSNAVEHAGPDVTVRVGAQADGFYVADDGPGIPEAERDQVFEPGYSTREEGTGFGLDIVSMIATAHDADVAVTDAAGGGARIEVRGLERA